MTTIGVLYDEWTKERFRRHYKMAKVIRTSPIEMTTARLWQRTCRRISTRYSHAGKLSGAYLKPAKLFGDGEEYGRIKKGFRAMVS